MSTVTPDIQQALEDLMTDYTYAVDSLSGADPVMALFTPDAVVDFSGVGFPRMDGESEIRAFFDELAKGSSHNFHMPANKRVVEADGDSGVIEAYVTGMGQPIGGDRILVRVKYRMEAVRDAGGWKCRHFSLAPMMPV